MGFFQARVLEWVAIFFSRESSRPRERTQVSSIADTLPSEPPGKPKKYALVNYKYFMFKVVEPPLKKKKERKRNLGLILNTNQKKRMGLTCDFSLMKRTSRNHIQIHGTQFENLCFNQYILDEYLYDVGHEMKA
ncbi:unnamed protein product [Rangifer tarandus platyrhynchus]|uniref:Uncharacterized protein n=1 Tax=Rangifer tarandus platyrhynchus TaxID=3082113 RepID=A0AC59Y5H8_RANTA